jgi:hypothetical protein
LISITIVLRRERRGKEIIYAFLTRAVQKEGDEDCIELRLMGSPEKVAIYIINRGVTYIFRGINSIET